jgi:hypothetical protein
MIVLAAQKIFTHLIPFIVILPEHGRCSYCSHRGIQCCRSGIRAAECPFRQFPTLILTPHIRGSRNHGEHDMCFIIEPEINIYR